MFLDFGWDVLRGRVGYLLRFGFVCVVGCCLEVGWFVTLACYQFFEDFGFGVCYFGMYWFGFRGFG